VLGLFEQGELWTSIALRRGPAGFNLVLGPDEVRSDMGLLAGDWRRDYRHLSRAIEDRGGPLALGCYAEVATLRKLEVHPTPRAPRRPPLPGATSPSPRPPRRPPPPPAPPPAGPPGAPCAPSLGASPRAGGGPPPWPPSAT